jgi:hypothetical protein
VLLNFTFVILEGSNWKRVCAVVALGKINSNKISNRVVVVEQFIEGRFCLETHYKKEKIKR